MQIFRNQLKQLEKISLKGKILQDDQWVKALKALFQYSKLRQILMIIKGLRL